MTKAHVFITNDSMREELLKANGELLADRDAMREQVAVLEKQRDTIMQSFSDCFRELGECMDALEAAPKPRIDNVCANYECCECWDCWYYTWFDLQRRDTLALCQEGE